MILVARDAASVRAQAPAFLTRSFFWAYVYAGWVLSDEQLPLARLLGLEIDRGVLVSRLTTAELSYPFSLHSVWRGVSTLRPGEYVKVSGSAAPKAKRFWSPPAPTHQLAELAPRLAGGLRAALEVRTAGLSAVSTDLSGGLDSTTLSFYVAEGAARQHTFFLRSTTNGNNDELWAMRAAREINSHHLVAPYQDAMSSVAGDDLIVLDRFPEGPSLTSASAAATPWIASHLEPTGSTLHLNGHGGDALFGPVSTMLWSLVHSRTPRRLRRALRHCALNRIPLRAAATMLLHRGGVRADLARLANRSFAQPRYPQAEYAHWVVTPLLHPALTDEARAEFTRRVRAEAGGDLQEFSPDRTIHQIVQFLTVHGTDVRRMNHVMGSDASVYFDSPYLDLRVVGPALALSISDRACQYPVKPLLAAGRPDTMSIAYFLRRDKSDYSGETFREHDSQRERIRSLFSDGSELENMGLISAPEFLRSLKAYSPDGQSYIDITYLEIAERWLRSMKSFAFDNRYELGVPC